MADAKKCDICGSLYEIYNTANNAEKPNGFRVVNRDHKGAYWEHEITDCCPECMQSILNHIKSLRGEVKKPVYDKVCFNCKYYKNEPDSDYCKDCITPDYKLSKWTAPEEKKLHRCDTCIFQDSGSEGCKQCVTDANDPNCIPSMWSPKSLMATSLTINSEDYTAIATLEDHWRGPLNERIIPGEFRDHYTCTIDGVEREVVLSPKVIEDLKKWR